MIGPINPTTIKYSLRGLLREVHVVTEWRDNCVYKTKRVGFIVCTSDKSPVKGAQLVSPSTKYLDVLRSTK